MKELYPAGFNRGFTETFARYGILLDRLAMAEVNPIVTGYGMYLMTEPIRANPIATSKTPAIMVAIANPS